MVLEKITAFQRIDRDKLKLFELMAVTLILLVVVGVMLGYLINIVNRSREVALKNTARILYMAVLDYTASGKTQVSDEQEEPPEPITEHSAFLRDYVGGSIKGALRVTLDESGYVQGIAYTEGNKTVTLPDEKIITNNE